MPLIRRDDDARNDLFAWWDGSGLDAESSFVCEDGEAVLVIDASNDALLCTLGPGRHALPPQLAGSIGHDVIVIFVTTRPLRLEAEGVLDDLDDSPWVELSTRVTVRDAVKAIELLPRLDDDEAPEDWVAEELLLAVSQAAEAHGGKLEALQRAVGSLAATTKRLANETLAELGIEVSEPELAFVESQETDELPDED